MPPNTEVNKQLEMITNFSCVVSCNNLNRPKFRIWLNDKMLLEQTYICNNEYEVLYETCELDLESGFYNINLESLTSNIEFNVSKIKINDVAVGTSFTI